MTNNAVTLSGRGQIPVRNKLTKSISSLSLSKDDLKRLCEKLQERSDAAAELEIRDFKRNPEQTEEQHNTEIEELRAGFLLSITITGSSGEELYGSIEEVFNSPNFPDRVKSFYTNSETKLRTRYNYYPRNSFDLFLDFSKPNLFDFSLLPSSNTPNNSLLQVQGYDATWANGFFNEICNFVSEKSSAFSRVHKHSVYDILLAFSGFPFGFWVCYKMSALMECNFFLKHIFLKNATYLYIFLIALWIFRIIFHYIRWVCPLVEYKYEGNSMSRHRVALGTIILALTAAVIYDFLKLFILN